MTGERIADAFTTTTDYTEAVIFRVLYKNVCIKTIYINTIVIIKKR